MALVSSGDMLRVAAEHGYGIPSFCVWSAEGIELTLRTANKMNAPVLIMSGPGEFPTLEPKDIAEIAKFVARRFDIPVALHLDHGDSVSLVEECVRSGFTSVMLDLSTEAYEENVRGMREVVRIAKSSNVTVEGEIGTIGRAETSQAEESGRIEYTAVEDAERFVLDTGIDILAVSIGNRHGFYRGDPVINVERAREIYAAVKIPLVLHGGTGTPPTTLTALVKSGVAKINVASEIVHGIREDLTRQWSNNENFWVPIAIGETKRIVEPILERWFRATGAANRA